MDVIKKRRKGKREQYKVYHKLEADELQIQYKHWQEFDTIKEGDWVLTDDDYICEVIQIRSYKNKKAQVNREYVYSIGRMWESKTNKLEYLPRKELHNFSTVKPQSHVERELKTRRAKDTIMAYTQMMLSGKVNYEMLGNIYRPDQLVPEATVRRFLRQDKVREQVAEELEKILVDNGVTKEFAVKLILEAIDAARIKGSSGDLLKCSQEIQELLGMKKDKKMIKTTETQEIEGAASFFGLIDSESERNEKVKAKRQLQHEIEVEDFNDISLGQD